jgi:hypothetical protein
MALENLKTALQTAEAKALSWRMSLDAWAADQEMHADKVALFRRYADGDHDANLTAEMRKMLRITDSEFDRFNDNYMGIVIDTLVDRLRVTGFKTDVQAADQWIAQVLEANRFDALQTDTHEAAVRDGNTYALVTWDNDLGQIVLTHEPAWDGTNGMLVVHNPQNQVVCGVKSWQEQLGEVTRVNLYYADHIERYIGTGSGALTPYANPDGTPPRSPWLLPSGEPIGCPVIHFPNRGTTWNAYGLSEIENAIPLQNALNRTLYSMVMTEELSAFPILVFVGCQPGGAVMPGMMILISPNAPLTTDQRADVKRIEGGDMKPFIEQAQWLTSEIGKITRTPAPEFMGSDSASGEALKQREIGLLGKVKRFQVKAGNRWEDAMKLAARVQTAFGNDTPPAFTKITTQWADAELRNDETIGKNATVLANLGFVDEALRAMAPVFGWDETKILEILASKASKDAAGLENVLGRMPQSFSNASFGLTPAQRPPNGDGAGLQPQEMMING